MSKKGRYFVGGVFFGTVIGGALGMLFAPNAGDQTRKKIKETSEDAFGDYFNQAKETAHNVYVTINDKVVEYKSQIEDKIGEFSSEIEEDIDKVELELDDQVDDEKESLYEMKEEAKEADDAFNK